MKKFLSLALVGAVVLGVSSVVYANVCAFDPVPAATLLFPFVAYDYNGGTSGATTLFSITNVSSEAQIVHVTLWTDFSIAILDFNILLTGYDVQRMNIRDILADGQLPVTVSSTHAGGVVDDGPVSEANQLNGDWVGGLMAMPDSTASLGARCASGDAAYPGQYINKIPPGVLSLFKQWLQSSQTEGRYFWDCDATAPYPGGFWFDTRDDTTPTWMYITADVVETCNKTFPDEGGYFTGEARYDNVLMGDVQWLGTTPEGVFLSEADTAVALEADMDLGMVATASDIIGLPISFYARYAGVNDGVSDFREPLPTAWAFRYMNDATINVDTYIRAWKGSTSMATIYDLDFTPYNESPTMFVADNCWAYTYYTWDDDENVESSITNPWSQPGHDYVIPNLLPLETQEVHSMQFNTVADYGWMLFVWPQSNVDVGVPLTAPWVVGDPDYYQTWMGVKYTGFGQFSAGTSATVMANYNCFSQQVLPNLGVAFEYVDATGYVVSADLP